MGWGRLSKSRGKAGWVGKCANVEEGLLLLEGVLGPQSGNNRYSSGYWGLNLDLGAGRGLEHFCEERESIREWMLLLSIKDQVEVLKH